MSTLVLMASLLLGSAFASQPETVIITSENKVVLKHQGIVKSTSVFYHFKKDKKIEVEKDQHPMMFCSVEQAKVTCETNPVEYIRMPVLTFWAFTNI